jgi:hypothetical protein
MSRKSFIENFLVCIKAKLEHELPLSASEKMFIEHARCIVDAFCLHLECGMERIKDENGNTVSDSL